MSCSAVCRQTFKFAYEAAGRLTAPSPPSFLGRLFGRASSQPTVSLWIHLCINVLSCAAHLRAASSCLLY